MLKGDISISKNLNSFKKLKILKPGAVFGEISYLSGNIRTTNVLAEDSVIALEFNENNLKKLQPEIELKIQKSLIGIIIKRLENLNLLLLDKHQDDLIC